MADAGVQRMVIPFFRMTTIVPEEPALRERVRCLPSVARLSGASPDPRLCVPASRQVCPFGKGSPRQGACSRYANAELAPGLSGGARNPSGCRQMGAEAAPGRSVEKSGDRGGRESAHGGAGLLLGLNLGEDCERPCLKPAFALSSRQFVRALGDLVGVSQAPGIEMRFGEASQDPGPRSHHVLQDCRIKSLCKERDALCIAPTSSVQRAESRRNMGKEDMVICLEAYLYTMFERANRLRKIIALAKGHNAYAVGCEGLGVETMGCISQT